MDTTNQAIRFQLANMQTRCHLDLPGNLYIRQKQTSNIIQKTPPAKTLALAKRLSSTLRDVKIPLISKKDMIIMKKLGGRVKDLIDLVFLSKSDNETDSEI